MPRLPVLAGPFESRNRYLEAIPRDKKLDRAWVDSLYRHGEKETYSDPSALAQLLRRAECDPAFLAGLRAHLSTRTPLFEAEREARSWQALLEELS